MAKTSTLTDGFATQDNAKWNYGAGASVASGQLVLATNSSYTGEITTDVTYDFTGSYLLVELAQRPVLGNGGTETGICVSLAPSITSSNTVGVLLGGSNLRFFANIAGAFGATNVAYNATNHRWLRIRESAGQVFTDTSPEGTSWTNQHIRSNPFTLTSVYVNLFNGYFGTETAPGNALFDNLNLPTATAPTASQFFAMINT